MIAPEVAPVVTTYEVRDASGMLVASKERTDTADGKTCRWFLPDGTPGLGGTPVADLPLYGIDRLGSDPTVFIVEGEKDADALLAVGIQAVGSVTGSSGTPSPAVLAELTGRMVYLWPDNDDVGRRHMVRIAERLSGVIGAEIVDWPAAPPAGGAADFLATHEAREVYGLSRRPPLTVVPDSPVIVPARYEWLHEVEVPDTETPMVLEPFVLDEGPAILFGDGDTGKSALALVLALSVASGRELIEGLRPTLTGPVMWIDYEAQRHTTRRRQRRIGHEAGILYVPGLRPLHEDVDELRRIAEREGVVLAVVDSIVAAVGGKVSPKDPEAPNLYAGAINAIAPRSLGLGHVPKDQADDGAKPFGSAYWHNVARLTWNARREPDEERHAVRLYNRKRNDGARFEPYEIEFDWSDGGLRVRTGRVGVKAQIVDILTDGPLIVADIAMKLGRTGEQTRTHLSRHRDLFVCEPGPPAVWRLA